MRYRGRYQVSRLYRTVSRCESNLVHDAQAADKPLIENGKHVVLYRVCPVGRLYYMCICRVRHVPWGSLFLIISSCIIYAYVCPPDTAVNGGIILNVRRKQSLRTLTCLIKKLYTHLICFKQKYNLTPIGFAKL